MPVLWIVEIYKNMTTKVQPLGTIKASQVVILNKDMQLLLNENWYK